MSAENREIIYTDDVFRAELALGYTLCNGDPATGDVVTLTEPQRFTLMSVKNGLERAIVAERTAAEAAGAEFDSDNWLPSEETIAASSAEYRIHRHYLRGIDGLKVQLEEMEAGLWDNGEPFYDHQLEGMRRLIADMEQHDPLAESSQGSYFNISGGGGKSRMIAMAIAGFKRLDPPDDPSHILFISHDNAGLAEVVGADGESGLGKYTPGMDIGIINKDNKEFGHEVTCTTATMLRRLVPTSEEDADDDTSAEDTGEPPAPNEQFITPMALVVSDESHRLLGKKTSQVINSIPRRVYGFTGSDRYSEQRRVSKLLGNELMAVGTYELIMKNNLAPLQFWVCKTNQVIHRESGRADYSQEELDRIAEMPARHQIAGDFGLAFFKDMRNGVFSCNNIAEADAFAKRISGDVTLPDGSIRKVTVVPVHSKNNKNYNEAFKALQADEIQGVTIVNIDTAWNVPRASFMVHLRPRTLVSANQVNARMYRRFVDDDGRILTSQIVDLCDIVYVKKKSGEDVTEEPVLPLQLFSPMLLGYDTYHAGMVVASPVTEGQRNDFSLSQFPPHIRRAVTLVDGMSLIRIAVFGAGVVREDVAAPDNYITLRQARLGLGVTTHRLRAALLSQSVILKNGELIDKRGLDKLAQHFIDTNEPII